MQRPREKLLHGGPATLSNQELIPILLGSGNSRVGLLNICRELVSAIDGQPAKLASTSIEKLCQVKGIGETKAILLTAAIELGKRAFTFDNAALILATNEQVSAFLAPYLKKQQEPGYFAVLLNDRKELLATAEYPIRQGNPPALAGIIRTASDAAAKEIVLCRPSIMLSETYLNKEKAFIIALDAAASMLTIKFSGLLVIPYQVEN